MDAKITFSAQGSITQTVKITDPGYTPERLVKELDSGELITTVQANGTVDVTASGKVVASVIDVANELEYYDFELRT